MVTGGIILNNDYKVTFFAMTNKLLILLGIYFLKSLFERAEFLFTCRYCGRIDKLKSRSYY